LQNYLQAIDVSGYDFTGCEKIEISGEISEKRPSAAKASVDSVGFLRGLKPPPPSVLSFSAACKVVP
jgi:hypothetical protein